MVLSGSNRTSSISSIVNINQGGGMKKAGLAPTETASVAQRRAYNSAPSILNLASMRLPSTSSRVVIGGIGMRFTNR
jgi:hypothetical protein